MKPPKAPLYSVTFDSSLHKTETGRYIGHQSPVFGSKTDKPSLVKSKTRHETNYFCKLFSNSTLNIDIMKKQVFDSNESAGRNTKLKTLRDVFASYKRKGEDVEKSDRSNTVTKCLNFADKETIGRKTLECCSCNTSCSKLNMHRYANKVQRYRKNHRFEKHVRTNKTKQIRSNPSSGIVKSTGLIKYKSKHAETNKSQAERPEPILHFVGVPNERGMSRRQPNMDKVIGSKYDDIDLFGCDADASNKFLCSSTAFSVKQNCPANKVLQRTIASSNHSSNQIHLLERNPFLSSFYAMNLQVHKHKKGYKLQPYECEPGVCIPGQCDPIDCQKRIMRRLIRKSSTMTSRKRRTKSISSETGYFQPDSRSQKQQAKEQQHAAKPKPAFEHHGLKYETKPKSQKQAVRVGSSFSFNIEFSKKRSNAAERFKKRKGSVTSTGTAWNGQHLKTQGTRYGVGNQSRESQSVAGMHHKGSGITPRYKRCFCTLKLQKRGYQQKATGDKIKVTRPVNVIKTTTTGQNTKKEKKYNKRNLDPYECEPYVCVPGQCNPYECLERIKRRDIRHFGTGPESRYVSTSIMTMTNDISSPTRGKYVQHNTKALRSGPVRKSKPISKSFVEPSRQAVRIRSSFTFDVEFFKDMAKDGLNVSPLSHNYYKPKLRIMTDKTQRNLHRGHSSDISIQNSRNYRDQNEQVKTATRHESTKTSSFYKRCFCTAQLFEPHPPYDVTRKTGIARRKKRSSSFMERIAVKFFPSRKSPNRRNAVKPKNKNNVGTFSQTDKIKEKRNQLEPYECEPGVCERGKCDPYVCAERIKRRAGNFNKRSSTDRLDTKSVSTDFYSSRASRSTSSNIRLPKHNYDQGKRRDQVEVKRLPISATMDRKAVKIGSTFSFNIDFFKDKAQAGDYYVSEKSAKEKTRSKIVSPNRDGTKIRTKGRGLDKAILLQSRESQVDAVKKEHKASGVGTMLKRCFCTLALKQTTRKVSPKYLKMPKTNGLQMVSNGAERPNSKVIPNVRDGYYKPRAHKLKPYECEPGVCTPGQCDPYLCEKLIRKRLHRESGTSPQKYHAKRKRSVYSVTDERQPQMRKLQMLKEHDNVKTLQHYGSRIVEKPRFRAFKPKNWQNVRVGSNVSISVEFFKENILPKNMVVHSNNVRDRAKDLRDKYINANVSAKRIPKKHTNTLNMSKDSEILAKQITESEASAAGKTLKRCFCTAKLHQAGADNIKNRMVTVGQVDVIQTMTPFKQNKYNVVKNPISGDGSVQKLNDKLYVNRNNTMKKKKTDKRQIQNRINNKTNPEKQVKINKIKQNGKDFQTTKKTPYQEIDMETILPYTPTKYKRNESNTLLQLKNKSNVQKKEVKSLSQITESAKRLTAKQENIFLSKHRGIKRLVYTCFTMFSKNNTQDTNKYDINDVPKEKKLKSNLKKSENDRKAYQDWCTLREPKGLKVTYADNTCRANDLQRGKTEHYPQSGDADWNRKTLQALKNLKIRPQFNKFYNSTRNETGNLTICSNECNESLAYKKTNREYQSGQSTKKSENKNVGGKNDKIESTKLLSNLAKHFGKKKPVESTIVKIKGDVLYKTICASKKQTNPTIVTVTGIDNSCEISKDLKSDISKDFVKCPCRCSKCLRYSKPISAETKTHNKQKNPHSLIKTTDPRTASKKKKQKKPRTGIKLELSRDYPIHHKGKKIHGKNIKHLKSTDPKARGSKKANAKDINALKKVQIPYPPATKPCVCGSFICNTVAKEQHLKRQSKPTKTKLKPCTCGSKICKRTRLISQKSTKKPKNRLAEIYKRRKQKEKIRRSLKELKKRRRLYKKEDEIRLNARKEREIQMLRQVRKYRKQSDVSLLAESVLDIGRLGFTTVADVLRSGVRTVIDPVNTYGNLKTMVTNPSRGCVMCKNIIRDSGVCATLKRIKMRLGSMKVVRAAKRHMESNAVTNCMLHMCDKDPKMRLKRQKKKKKIRKREPVDFECSLYMASLRRRPYLALYYMCPWFYPHFISMVHVWRQFVDVILFLLAVGVWSPCIFAAEACRAMMCCLLCNG